MKHQSEPSLKISKKPSVTDLVSGKVLSIKYLKCYISRMACIFKIAHVCCYVILAMLATFI